MDILSIAAFTHVQEKINRHSCIDHFFVASFDPFGLVHEICTIDSCHNFSDHLPLS